MKPSTLTSALAIFLMAGLTVGHAEEKAPATKPAASPEAKAEMDHSLCETVKPLSKIDKPVFLTQDAKKKIVCLHVIATLTEENYGMNFNGYAKGAATYTIPKGWKVEVTFVNNSPVPHSLVVVDEDTTGKLRMGEPYFDGATTPEAEKGVTNTEQKFTFTPDEAGDFAFACGFPSHSANGHWIKLNISDDAKEASFVTPAKKVEEK